MKKFLSLLVALLTTVALWAGNVITYTATEKLPETTSLYSDHSGLHTKAFDVSIFSHVFSNGIGTILFAGDVTSISGYAFYGCSGLTSIDIPNSVTWIGSYAFYGCYGLTSITIPNSVTTIVSDVFYGCSGLTSVTIPSSVTSIEYRAFYGCRGVTSIEIPSSVTTIKSQAFYLVNNIVYNGTATYEKKDEYWGAKCMNGYVDGNLVYSDNTKTKLCGCLSTATGEIVIPSSVTMIGDNAFLYCADLTNVTISNSVTTIGTYAFKGCTGLTSVTIGNSVTTIGEHAFFGCSGLTLLLFLIL